MSYLILLKFLGDNLVHLKAVSMR